MSLSKLATPFKSAPEPNTSILQLPTEMRSNILLRNHPVITLHQLGDIHPDLAPLTEEALQTRRSLTLEIGKGNFDQHGTTLGFASLPRQVHLDGGSKVVGAFGPNTRNDGRYRVRKLTPHITNWFRDTFKCITSLEVVHDRLDASLSHYLVYLLEAWAPTIERLVIWFAEKVSKANKIAYKKFLLKT